MMSLTEEQAALERLLSGRTVAKIFRHRERELVLEFSDGARLIVDAQTPLELSVTGDD